VARAGGNRVAKALHHVHGQAAAVDGYEVKLYAVRRTLGGDCVGGRLAEVLAIWSVTNDCSESVGRECGDIGCLNLRGDRAGFTKTVDSHPVRPRPKEA